MFSELPSRRFGRTEIDIPVLSLGGMRFQQSWQDLPDNKLIKDRQVDLDRLIKSAVSLGFHHLETARHYGTSETQLGLSMKKINDHKRILQTKVTPSQDPNKFEADLEISFQKLGCRKVDLLSIHGINQFQHLDQTIRPFGCFEVLKRWQKKGRIGYIGFSTHGPSELIVKAIETNLFDYVNLHWYFIRQENKVALEVAKKYDLGVFIISPTDKGGHLHSPSQKFLDLCSPIHPIVFNDLFCLRDERVHTISVGAANPKDLELHIQAAGLIDQANDLVPSIEQKLVHAASLALGDTWLSSWHVGLPSWEETPLMLNIPILLWLHNLIEAWEMENYARARYQLLGNGGHWFPGKNADDLDKISASDFQKALSKSPWRDEIPNILRKLRDRIGGDSLERLSNA